MKRVVYLAPIDHIVGKLPKSANVQGYVASNKLQGRISTKNKLEVNRLTLASIGLRSTKPGEDELAARARFAAVAVMVKNAKLDPIKSRQDAADFKAQTEIKTFKAFVWKKYGDEYDAAQGAGE